MDFIKQVILPIVLITFLVIWSILSFDKSQTRKSCENFSEFSNRETKYVEYTYWNVDCLTLLENGKWISAYLLRDSE